MHLRRKSSKKSATSDLSESSTSSTAGSSGRVSGNWSNVLDSSDFETISGKSSDGRLGSWSWGLGLNTTSGSELDVHGVDSDILESFAHVDGSKHSYSRLVYLSTRADPTAWQGHALNEWCLSSHLDPSNQNFNSSVHH